MSLVFEVRRINSDEEGRTGEETLEMVCIVPAVRNLTVPHLTHPPTKIHE